MAEVSWVRTDSEIDDLVAEIKKAGIIATTLGDLRIRIAHVDRLGKHVLALIEQKLDGHGIGYLPKTVFASTAPRQQQEARLYLHDSSIGRVIDAVLDPSTIGDAVLKELAMSVPDHPVANDVGVVRDALGKLQTAEAILRDYLNEALVTEEGR